MKILLTGSHGLVGSALRSSLLGQGHEVISLVRGPSHQAGAEARWDPAAGFIEADALEGIQAVIHLAGENLASGRWTAARKQRIRDSRVAGTRLLSATVAKLTAPPAVFLSASATGYYGDRGQEILTEASSVGSGFLAEVCQDWEEATAPAMVAQIRVVLLRFGVVLAPGGGALKKMLPLFRLGLGGKLGSGRQFWSWIHIDDALGAMAHALQVRSLAGAVNVVSPQPVMNAEFTQILGRVLRRPTFVPAPGWALRIALGEMADAALLASARVMPERLLASGFRHRFPELRNALKQVIK